MSHLPSASKITKLIVLPILAFLTLTGIVLPAKASPQETGAGIYTSHRDMTTSIFNDNGAQIYHEDASGSLSGVLTGNLVQSNYWSVRSDGSYQVHGLWTCSPCTLNGKTGSLTAEVALTGDENGCSGMLGITEASGELAGIQGKGYIQSTITNSAYNLNYKQEIAEK
jgi:hypothetical protein